MPRFLQDKHKVVRNDVKLNFVTKYWAQVHRWRRQIAGQWRSQFPDDPDEVLEQDLRIGVLVLVLAQLWELRWPSPPAPLPGRERGEWKVAEVLGEIQAWSGRLVPERWMAIAPRLIDFPDLPIAKDTLEIPDLSWLYEQCLGHPVLVKPELGQRKTRGIYYTPPALIEQMIQDMLAGFWANRDAYPEVYPEAFRVLDPACGSGAFLLAAYEALLQQDLTTDLATRQQIAVQHLYGVDLDGDAVAIARLVIWLKSLEGCAEVRPLPLLRERIRQGNALVRDEPPSVPPSQGGKHGDDPPSLPPSQGGKHGDDPPSLPPCQGGKHDSLPLARGGLGRGETFDIVLGNPPYLDSETMTTSWPELRDYCRQHYATATGNWDIFGVFIERSLELCRPGGLVSLVVPNKLVSAPYAATVRSLLTQSHQLLKIYDYSQVAPFGAAVYPIVILVQNHSPDPAIQVEYHQITGTQSVTHKLPYHALANQPEHPWLLADAAVAKLITRLQREFPELGTIAEIRGAATVGEAYALKGVIRDCSTPTPDDLKFVNSGTIDPYRVLWGEKPCRYLGQSFRYPVLPLEWRSHLPPRRLAQALQPKLIVAGMARQLECVGDMQGEYLAGKSTSIITSTSTSTSTSTVNLDYLLGILNSNLLSFYLKTLFRGNQLQGGYLRIGPPQLRQLPIPIPDFSSDESCELYEALISLVKKRRSLSPSGSFPPVESLHQLDTKINNLVNQLYHLTAEEQALLATLIS
jgi:hypothetical protein